MILYQDTAMITGLVFMEDRNIVEEIKHLDKRSQVELLRSLMQQLEPEIVAEAAEDISINIGNNNNRNNITYADMVLNLYLNEDSECLANLLDAAAYRLRTGNRQQGTGNRDYVSGRR